MKKNQLEMMLGSTIFVALCLWIGYLAFYHCFYNWDMLPYTALALQWNGVTEIHSATYHVMQAQVPPNALIQLTTGSYPQQMAQNSADFISQLTFYVVKPLYIALLAGLYALGLPMISAMMTLSAFSVMAACAVVMRWLSLFVPLSQAASLTVLLAYATRLVDLARGGSPDGLSVLIVLLGLYWILERKSAVQGLLLLALAISVRPNNVIFFTLVGAFLMFQQPSIALSATFVAGIILYMLISQLGESWWLLFYHTFIEQVDNLSQFSQPFSWSLYYQVLADSGQALLVRGLSANTMLWVFAFGAGLLYARVAQVRPWLGLMALNVLAIMLLFPAVLHWDRFLVPFYLWIAIALTERLYRPSLH